jgi:hypothetical protein
MGSPRPCLEKWRRNNIFEAVQATGLDPGEFDLGDDGFEVRIKHEATASCFTFRRNDHGDYVWRYVAGDNPPWELTDYSWQTLIGHISRWLEDVKRDIGTLDLWADRKRQVDLLGVNFDVIENTPFTPDEQRDIATRLWVFAETMGRTHSLSGEQMRILNEKINYLVNAADRLGRKDWYNAFIGVAIGYTFAAALPPESTRSIFWGFVRAIEHLYPLLPGG